MIYTVKIVYKDKEDIQINMSEEMVNDFLDSINSNEIYWNLDKTHAFWTDINEVRYIQVMGIKDAPVEPIPNVPNEKAQILPPQEVEVVPVEEVIPPPPPEEVQPV